MNPLDPFNQVSQFTSQPNPVFEPKFLNLDYLFYKIYLFVTGGSGGNMEPGSITFNAPSWWMKLFGGGGGGEVAGAHTFNMAMLTGFIKDLLYFLMLVLIAIITYSVIRIFEIRKKEHEHLHHEIAEFAHKQKQKTEIVAAEKNISRNDVWVKVLKNLDSTNEADWRVAIIDADKMLDTLTDQLGLYGETLGERLKSADRDRFKSLNEAWEAHNVRNKIAHDGSAFVLTKREADRVVALYEKVFNEFGYI